MRVRKRHPLFRDPTTRYVGRDELGSVLAGLDPELVEILSAYLHGVAPSRLARRMNTAVDYGVHMLILHALKAIRESPGSESLREELLAEHGPRYSRTLRAVARRMEIDGAPRCRHCATPLVTASATGRPRQYCGNACRQAAYRERRRDRTSGSGRRHGLTPPPVETEPAPLPRKQPRHGYRPGEPGYEEYVARLLNDWRTRRPAPDRVAMYANRFADRERSRPRKPGISVAIVGMGVVGPPAGRDLYALLREEVGLRHEPDRGHRPTMARTVIPFDIAADPTPAAIPLPRHARRSKNTRSDTPYWLPSPIWHSRKAARHIPPQRQRIWCRAARRGG